MEKGKRLNSNNGETLLPEAMIQHIQSFLTRREAARTALLSKSWYQAWLTRPTLDFDQCDFQYFHDQSPGVVFEDFASKSMQRYQDLNLKIDNFRLHTVNCERDNNLLTNRLIVKAMKLGATHLNLELWPSKFVLPRQVLGSETLVGLHVSGRNIYGNVKWRSLKLLVLENVRLRNGDMLRDIVSSCKLLEELSILNCTGTGSSNSMFGRGNYMIDLSGMKSNEHHRLQRLLLENVCMNPLFFSNFASRFPCLKDLSIASLFYPGELCIQIVSTSLQRISFVSVKPITAELHVPNLVHFRHSGAFVPSLRIESSRECEFEITITFCDSTLARPWRLHLKSLLTRLMAYKISLSIDISLWFISDVVEGDTEVDSKPLVLDNLTIDPIDQPTAFKIMTCLFGFCRPNFLTVYWHPYPSRWQTDDFIVNVLCKKLMKEMISPNCGIPDQSVFGQHGLKEVSIQVYEEILTEWQPLLNLPLHSLTTPENKRKFCFQLRWG